MNRPATLSPLPRRLTMAAVLLALALAAGVSLARRAAAEQPHMQAALDALTTAESELSKATADKGGHRARAVRHVRLAIEEVKKGMEVSRSN